MKTLILLAFFSLSVRETEMDMKISKRNFADVNVIELIRLLMHEYQSSHEKNNSSNNWKGKHVFNRARLTEQFLEFSRVMKK